MKKVLNSNTLKIIAIIAMTIDHLTWIIFPGYQTNIIIIILHLIGRLTCPIMCYFISEGFHHTKDINKYTLRLFIFAIISHFAYIFGTHNFNGLMSFIPFANGSILDQTSVMWSLAWGLVMLRINYSTKIKNNFAKVLLILLVCIITIPSDWSCIASLIILAFGTNRDNFKKQMFWLVSYSLIYALVYFFAIDKVYGILQLGTILSIPVLYLYNGQRGKNIKVNKVMKWFFYIYYPFHFIVLGIIQLLIK